MSIDVIYLNARRTVKTPNRQTRLRLPEIGCAVLILFALIFLRIRASTTIEDGAPGAACPTGPARPDQIAGLLRVQLPTTVTQIETFQTGERDQYCEVYAKLRLPASEVTGFLQSTRIRPPLAAAPALAEFSSLYRRSPWKPDSSVQYFCGRSASALDYMQYICIDTSSETANILYITVDYLLP